MSLFRLGFDTPPLRLIEGKHVFLRPPQMSDFPAWESVRSRSRAFLTPWEPVWGADDLTRAGFRRRLRHYAEDMRADLSYPFFVFRKSDDVLVGGITLANVRRGIAQTGSVGYWIGVDFARRGLMSDALGALLPYLFGELNLHRVEAACIPANVPSIALLERCGFAREGLARRYLCINGAWQDHYLYAILADDARRYPRAARLLPAGIGLL